MMCLTCLEKYILALVLIACGENVKQEAYDHTSDIGYRISRYIPRRRRTSPTSRRAFAPRGELRLLDPNPPVELYIKSRTSYLAPGFNQNLIKISLVADNGARGPGADVRRDRRRGDGRDRHRYKQRMRKDQCLLPNPPSCDVSPQWGSDEACPSHGAE